MSKLPIGIQDFESLILEGYTYVDKTQYIHTLIQGSKYQFISRPRRFGKSLLLSTLGAIYEGKKHLFTGLWIENQHDFKPRPIICLDFSLINSEQGRLEASVLRSLRRTAEQYHIHNFTDNFTPKPDLNSPRDALEDLIYALAKIDKVVILIDEYDKPITEYLFDPEKRLEQQAILRSIYGLLKPMGQYLHQVILTGVSKIGKLSLFSDLNNLQDISLEPQFAEMLGYTRAEIERHYPDHLELARKRLDLPLEQFWDILKFWYNGYSWDGETRLYCPFSALLFLSSLKLKSYWYQTATPAFLVKMIENHKINPLDFEKTFSDEKTLSTFDVGNLDPISIMFQTGYLTIQSLQEKLQGIEYQLGYPNQEVRQAFSSELLEQYTGQVGSQVAVLAIQIRDSLDKLEWGNFFELVQSAYASIPYLISSKEKHFHSLFHMLMCATGFLVYSELLTNRGRIDTLLDTRAFYVIFEFKMEGTAQAALEQINTTDYAEQFITRAPVYKIGVVFDEGSRNIKEWQVDK
jgi:PAS domain-containing protein